MGQLGPAAESEIEMDGFSGTYYQVPVWRCWCPDSCRPCSAWLMITTLDEIGNRNGADILSDTDEGRCTYGRRGPDFQKWSECVVRSSLLGQG